MAAPVSKGEVELPPPSDTAPINQEAGFVRTLVECDSCSLTRGQQPLTNATQPARCSDVWKNDHLLSKHLVGELMWCERCFDTYPRHDWGCAIVDVCVLNRTFVS